MKKKFSLSGFPSFNHFQNVKREYITSILKKQFNLFGFSPIKTSCVEKRSNLYGQYGDEGDKLIFQILKSGNYLNKVENDLNTIPIEQISSLISDKALRYDLTVPLARFVSENKNNITFPFKRYEIGPVWRADRPQKGRLREFTQCDADIVGESSLWLEVEIINLIISCLKKIKLFDFSIQINNRKILEGLFTSFKSNLSFEGFCIIIDKISKIGKDKVLDLLIEGGFSYDSIELFSKILFFKGTISQQQENISQHLKLNSKLEMGFLEIHSINDRLSSGNFNNYIHLDLTLARGLDYYSGIIFEVVSIHNPQISIAGGGRYDKLTEKFNVKNLSGVGVSFGLDRLTLLMEELDLFPENTLNSLDFLFVNFGDEEAKSSSEYINNIRDLGYSVELYPSPIKISKQLSYANQRNTKLVIMIGEDEIKMKNMLIKNMSNGQQIKYSFNNFLKALKNNEFSF
ncbi:MAG: histidine--tRNA ligase [Flavobacteriales bacterium]|nr:histidine--tRNA ligase [Flavobacteriales bacterium]|tara:strand:- start:26150 stop:27526 length:1377 start_codon:yes stop_codon:yes gene_type:complete